MSESTPDKIDAALDRILYAAGASKIRHYMPKTKEAMRAAMRSVLDEHAESTGASSSSAPSAVAGGGE